MITDNLADLMPLHYRVIMADPPWAFENYSAKGEYKNPKRHYPTMSPEAIAALPIGQLAAPDSVLFMWVVSPLLHRAFDVLTAWGFTYKTMAFTWAKRTKLDTGWHMGTGYYTRANAEICLLATMGRPGMVASRKVRSLVVEPIREHSRKPDRIRDDIEELYPHGPYLELFARSSKPGWDAWGNQVEKFGEVAC